MRCDAGTTGIDMYCNLVCNPVYYGVMHNLENSHAVAIKIVWKIKKKKKKKKKKIKSTEEIVATV